MLTGCGGAHPVSGGVVLAYRAHDDARGSVVDNWSLTDANGMYSFPLGEHAHYRIVLVGPGGEQLSIGPEGGRGSQFHPIDTVDDPIRLDLDATVGCM